MTIKEEIADIRKDMATFFKWYALQTEHASIQYKKHEAIKAQNFEMAVEYREEEKKCFEKWKETNDQLHAVADKYIL